MRPKASLIENSPERGLWGTYEWRSVQGNTGKLADRSRERRLLRPGQRLNGGASLGGTPGAQELTAQPGVRLQDSCGVSGEVDGWIRLAVRGRHDGSSRRVDGRKHVILGNGADYGRGFP